MLAQYHCYNKSTTISVDTESVNCKITNQLSYHILKIVEDTLFHKINRN